MRLYVSGPITGLPDLNKPEFERVTKELLAAGHEFVINPHTVCTIIPAHECQGPCTPSELMLPWADYLRSDLIAMLTGADALAMLDGWVNSKGAVLERQVAEGLGWEVRPWEEWL